MAEWLNEIVETDTGDGPDKSVKLYDIFSYGANGIVCKICSDAKIKGEFSTGKTWTEWKLDYLKRHLTQKCHVDAVKALYNRKHGTAINQLLRESRELREKRIDLSNKSKSNPEQVKILIDNVLLAIKMNASMLSVQEIHNHLAKYVNIPDSWRSKNYAFEFVESINAVVQAEIMESLRNASAHTLIVDESTDITVHKMPLNEVRWLSRYQAVNAFLRNYSLLTEYCKKEVDNDDPIAKYCLKKLSDPKYKVAITVLGDVLDELAQLSVSLQRSNLSIIDAHCFARAKMEKLRSQYLGHQVFWSNRVNELLGKHDSAINTADIILFVSKVCDHLDARFPEGELKEWSAFSLETLDSTLNFDHGTNDVSRLIEKFHAFLKLKDNAANESICQQYKDFKFTVKEKRKTGALQTFAEMVTWTLKSQEFAELAQLIDICGTFQASSADCERGFSLINRIKTNSRSRLQTTHLDQLMRIRSTQADGSINLDKVYNHWKMSKDRLRLTVSIFYWLKNAGYPSVCSRKSGSSKASFVELEHFLPGDNVDFEFGQHLARESQIVIKQAFPVTLHVTAGSPEYEHCILTGVEEFMTAAQYSLHAGMSDDPQACTPTHIWTIAMSHSLDMINSLYLVLNDTDVSMKWWRHPCCSGGFSSFRYTIDRCSAKAVADTVDEHQTRDERITFPRSAPALSAAAGAARPALIRAISRIDGSLFMDLQLDSEEKNFTL
ncbi:hypothetical protein DNTS_027367 [Danionella cerebrum]|uniref:HAT C-terminal dimerisation domain-containing protein n=1 Tax=Danionella cerebrum TaxID=2873325 RepID=A0A553MU86_9TELE|nr:hypothetical protein DNTS_027367 [Danionella translucida]